MKRLFVFVMLLMVVVACTRPAPVVTPVVLPTASLPSPPTTGAVLSTPTYVPPPGFDPAVYRPAMRPEYAADVNNFADAPRYVLQIEVDLSVLEATGREQVRYTNTDPVTLNEIYFRLFPASPVYGAAMTVTAVTVNGQPVVPQLEQQGTVLRVPVTLSPGAFAELALDFAVHIPRDPTAGYAMFGLAEGVTALPDFYPVIPVYDESGWHIEVPPTYGDETFNPTALYSVTITAPPTQTVVTSGTCQKPMANTWHCVSGPMRDFMLAMSADYHVVSKVVDGVTVRSFYLPDHATGGQRALQVAVDALRIFSRRFGPYPFAELDVVETPTRAGGIEYPGLVVIADRLYPQSGNSGYFDFVVAHEVAHQWWYSLVGDDQVNHPWLDEALAEYASILYFEDAFNKAVADQLVRQVLEEPYQQLVQARRDQKVDQPVAAFTEQDYGVVVYRKGALFFRALREAIGDVKFDAFLKTYFSQNRYGIATPQRLLAVAESVADRATVRSLYSKWIESATTP